MFSARALTRSAPRALLQRIARPATISRPSTLVRAQCTPARTQISAFSTSLLRRSHGKVDAELSQKLNAEMQFETGVRDTDAEPVAVKDFRDNSLFKIKDTPGMQDIVLTRTYGNEK